MTTTTQPITSAASQPTRPLAGRVAVVTGATSGIGAETARRLAADGAAVALLGRREARLRALADELTATASADGADGTAAATVLPFAADVQDSDAFAAVAERIRAELGPVDLVVANAGAMLGAPFESADVAEWDRMLDTNVRGLLRTGRAFADDLIAAAAEGRPADLVHVGSIGGHQPFVDYGVYCATKAAVAQLTRSLRLELGPRGVRVKVVEPGFTVTELGDDIRDERVREQLAGWRTAIEPLAPQDIAAAIGWAVAAPPHVNVAELVVVPTQQG